MTRRSRWDLGRVRAARHSILLLQGALSAACLGDGASSSTQLDGERTQGGARDMADLRRMVEDDQVPSSESLDEAGFFEAHSLELPAPRCEGSLCAHSLLAVAPTFGGANWTVAFVGLNPNAEEGDLRKQPRHLIVLREATNEVALPADFSTVLADELEKTDRVSVIEFGAPKQLTLNVGLTPLELRDSGDFQERLTEHASSTDLFQALERAHEISQKRAFKDHRTRVLVVTSGRSEGGHTTRGSIAQLATQLAREDLGISVFGVGRGFERPLALALTEASGGPIYVTEKDSDFLRALRMESSTHFVPLARNLKIRVVAAQHYSIENTYGIRRVRSSNEWAELDRPVVFLGTGRKGSTPALDGSYFHLEPDPEYRDAPEERDALEETAPVLEVRATYDDALSNVRREQAMLLRTPLGVGGTPVPSQAYFDAPSFTKPFLVLTMYAALRGMISYYEQGNCASAIGMRKMIEGTYQPFAERHEDEDITKDFDLLVELEGVLVDKCDEAEGQWPAEADIGYFF